MWNKNFLLIMSAILILSAPIMGDWEDRKGPPPVVSLTDLVKNPESWLDIPVRITVRFAAIRNIYTPYFTTFDRDRFLNFSAWDTHTHIWQKKGFMSDYPFFYVEKDAKEFKAFLRLKRFDTIAVMGKIVSIFKGRPYIRIVWMCKQDGELNVHNLTMLNRASKSYDNGQFDAAIGYYKQIFKTNPPEDIKALMYKSMGKISLYNNRNYKEALNYLNKGLEIAKNDPQLLQMHAQCEYYLQHGGEEPQPITIESDEIEDFEVEQETLQPNYTRIDTAPTNNNTSNSNSNSSYTNTGTSGSNNDYSSTQYKDYSDNKKDEFADVKTTSGEDFDDETYSEDDLDGEEYNYEDDLDDDEYSDEEYNYDEDEDANNDGDGVDRG